MMPVFIHRPPTLVSLPTLGEGVLLHVWFRASLVTPPYPSPEGEGNAKTRTAPYILAGSPEQRAASVAEFTSAERAGFQRGATQPPFAQ